MADFTNAGGTAVISADGSLVTITIPSGVTNDNGAFVIQNTFGDWVLKKAGVTVGSPVSYNDPAALGHEIYLLISNLVIVGGATDYTLTYNGFGDSEVSDDATDLLQDFSSMAVTNNVPAAGAAGNPAAAVLLLMM
jgi:hypothetical protein